MNCNDMKSKMPDLLLESDENALVLAKGGVEQMAEVQGHLAECANCRDQLDDLRATMALLDAWEAPEPNPYFLTRLNARLDDEREAAPASWFERVRARLMYSSRYSLRPVAAMTMSVMLLLGGGAYLGFTNWDQQPAQGAAPVVHDLQSLDSNAQLLDQLESMSNQND
jgi:predicted anti-sigma-YlaC factor YlaD